MRTVWVSFCVSFPISRRYVLLLVQKALIAHWWNWPKDFCCWLPAHICHKAPHSLSTFTFHPPMQAAFAIGQNTAQSNSSSDLTLARISCLSFLTHYRALKQTYSYRPISWPTIVKAVICMFKMPQDYKSCSGFTKLKGEGENERKRESIKPGYSYTEGHII